MQNYEVDMRFPPEQLSFQEFRQVTSILMNLSVAALARAFLAFVFPFFWGSPLASIRSGFTCITGMPWGR